MVYIQPIANYGPGLEVLVKPDIILLDGTGLSI
jgi:hypothetical protein